MWVFTAGTFQHVLAKKNRDLRSKNLPLIGGTPPWPGGLVSGPVAWWPGVHPRQHGEAQKVFAGHFLAVVAFFAEAPTTKKFRAIIIFLPCRLAPSAPFIVTKANTDSRAEA
jgi:hypothetical protein